MSVHYILDGYNIISSVSSLAGSKLETSRDNLLKFLQTTRPQGSENNAVTVVFDGQPDMGGLAPTIEGIRVTFSSHDSADDEIKRLVDDADNRKNMVVVTDDREIQYYVRALGAKVLSVHEFFEKARPSAVSKQTKTDKPIASGKNISKTVEHKINVEFEEFWLKRKKKN